MDDISPNSMPGCFMYLPYSDENDGCKCLLTYFILQFVIDSSGLETFYLQKTSSTWLYVKEDFLHVYFGTYF